MLAEFTLGKLEEPLGGSRGNRGACSDLLGLQKIDQDTFEIDLVSEFIVFHSPYPKTANKQKNVL